MDFFDPFFTSLTLYFNQFNFFFYCVIDILYSVHIEDNIKCFDTCHNYNVKYIPRLVHENSKFIRSIWSGKQQGKIVNTQGMLLFDQHDPTYLKVGMKYQAQNSTN